MHWVLSGVCAAAVSLILYKIIMHYCGGKDDDNDDEGFPDPPRYNLRTRPTAPAIDPSVYLRY